MAQNEKMIPNRSMFDIWIPNQRVCLRWKRGLKGDTSLLTLTEGITHHVNWKGVMLSLLSTGFIYAQRELVMPHCICVVIYTVHVIYWQSHKTFIFNCGLYIVYLVHLLGAFVIYDALKPFPVNENLTYLGLLWLAESVLGVNQRKPGP